MGFWHGASLLYFAYGVAFVWLVSIDAWNAFKRKMHWVPGRALVFSYFTLQLFHWIDYSSARDLYSGGQYDLFMDGQRLLLCVFISYLLPEMVTSSLRVVISGLGPLVLSVLLHMFYDVWYPTYERETMWPIVFDATLCTVMILLLLLLASAVLAGKSIRNINCQKVLSALSCCSNYPEKQECKSIEDHVLKSWIVVRASQPDYIMARSALSSLACFLVTLCIVIFVLKWRYVHASLICKAATPLHIIQFVFIIVGWIIVLFRWFTAVLYFPRNLRGLFYFEDFWTRNIVAVQEDLHGSLKGRLFGEKRNRQTTISEIVVVYLVRAFRLHFLVFPICLGLQKLIVFLSKACWSLSEISIRMIRRCIISQEKYMLLSGLNISSALESDQFSKYRKALEIVRMPGEMACSLWIANESAFKETEKHMIQGCAQGMCRCEKLKNLIGHDGGTCENGATTWLEEENFMYFGKKSWKMKAVSLIYFIIHLYDGTNSDVVNGAFEACSQAWDLVDIVDSSDPDPEDPETNLVSLAADKEFDTLGKIWKTHLEMTLLEGCSDNQSEQRESMKLLERKIKMRLRQYVAPVSTEQRSGLVESHIYPLEDSKDWMNFATNFNLQGISKSIDLHSPDAMSSLQCLLANVIRQCMIKEVQKAILEKCSKCAKECSKWGKQRMEEELFDVAYLAGKINGLLHHQIGERNVAMHASVCDPIADPEEGRER